MHMEHGLFCRRWGRVFLLRGGSIGWGRRRLFRVGGGHGLFLAGGVAAGGDDVEVILRRGRGAQEQEKDEGAGGHDLVKSVA